MLQANRLIDEETTKLDSSTKNESLNEKDNDPLEEDQEQKKDLFKSYLFSGAQNIPTPDLFSQIIDLIQGSNLEDIKIRNSEDEEEENDKKIEESEKDKVEEIDEKEPEFIIDDKGKKKYKHFYRGVVQLLDHPPKKILKKNYDSDDSYYSD